MCSSYEEPAENNIRQRVFHNKIQGSEIYGFFLKKGVKLDFIYMKMKTDEEWKIFVAKFFTKGTCNQNYGRFKVEGQQELRHFNMYFTYGNAFFRFFTCAACQKTNFYVLSYDKTKFKILCKFQIFPRSIHGEIPKKSELCEKRNNCMCAC